MPADMTRPTHLLGWRHLQLLVLVLVVIALIIPLLTLLVAIFLVPLPFLVSLLLLVVLVLAALVVLLLVVLRPLLVLLQLLLLLPVLAPHACDARLLECLEPLPLLPGELLFALGAVPGLGLALLVPHLQEHLLVLHVVLARLAAAAVALGSELQLPEQVLESGVEPVRGLLLRVLGPCLGCPVHLGLGHDLLQQVRAGLLAATTATVCAVIVATLPLEETAAEMKLL